MPEEIAVQTDPPKVDTGVQVDEFKLEPTSPTKPATASARPPTTSVQRPPTGSNTNLNSKPTEIDTLSQEIEKIAAIEANKRPYSSSSRRSTAQSILRIPSPPKSLNRTPSRSSRSPMVHVSGSVDRPILYIQQGQQMNAPTAQFNPRSSGNEVTPLIYSFNPDPRLRTWQRLEAVRLHKLGLSSNLSRRYNVARSSDFVPVGLHINRQDSICSLPPLIQASVDFYKGEEKKKNDLAPFLTQQKPSCGFYFSHDTDNRKIKHGIPAVDMLKWRSFQT